MLTVQTVVDQIKAIDRKTTKALRMLRCPDAEIQIVASETDNVVFETEHCGEVRLKGQFAVAVPY